MREKIPSVRIWPKSPKQRQPVPIAKILSFPIVSAPHVDIMQTDLTSPRKNPKNPKIGIDLLGGENSPEPLFDALVAWEKLKQEECSFLILATEEMCRSYTKKVGANSSFTFFPVKEAILLEENPLFAIRKKKGSSIAVGMRLLKEKKIDSLVSFGNTGALVASASIEIPMRKIHRPALLAFLPTKKNLLALIDTGANIVARAHELKEFALMGVALQKFQNIDRPKVGLLNIGSEAKKGTKEIQLAFGEIQKTAKEKKFLFEGNIEAKDIFEGNVDVLVTNGFTGNVLLKTAEGFSSFVLDFLKKTPLFREMQKLLSYAEYGGAFLLGVEGCVIKCHSYSSPQAFLSAVAMAVGWSSKDFPTFLRKFL